MSASSEVTHPSPMTSASASQPPLAAFRIAIAASAEVNLVVAVEVAFLQRSISPRLHEPEVIGVVAVGDVVRSISDFTVIQFHIAGIFFSIIAIVVANRSRVPLVSAGVACVVIGVVDEVAVVLGCCCSNSTGRCRGSY